MDLKDMLKKVDQERAEEAARAAALAAKAAAEDRVRNPAKHRRKDLVEQWDGIIRSRLAELANHAWGRSLFVYQSGPSLYEQSPQPFWRVVGTESHGYWTHTFSVFIRLDSTDTPTGWQVSGRPVRPWPMTESDLVAELAEAYRQGSEQTYNPPGTWD